jgi:hypothetical protein
MAFTMTLPNNSSMSVFPDNTLTTFNTLLPEYITASTPMECALLEITCPTSWYNVLPENIVLIQGESESLPKDRGGIKRLQHVLMKRGNHFFPQVKYNDLSLSRSTPHPHDTILAECLTRGVEISRTSKQRDPLRVPVVPSGVRLEDQETTEEAEEAEKEAQLESDVEELEEEVEETVTYSEPEGEELPFHRDERAISHAVAAVRDTMLTHEYDEVGVFIYVRKQLTPEELRIVKSSINIKALDKLVSVFNFRTERNYRVFSLPGVYLKDNADFVNYLNKYFNRRNPVIVRRLRTQYKNANAAVFTYSRYTMKCTVSLPPDVILQIPPNLGLQLGFGGGTFLIGKSVGRHVVDLQFRAQTVYVYSDVVKHSVVGDKRAPLLRVVNINPRLGDTQTVTFQPLIYQPVSKNSFRQVAVYLRDSTGQPIPFERGAVTVVLAFRPVSHLLH